MKKANLITILSAFSKKEMKRFGQFVDSPYFHTGRNLKPLYLLLKKNHPEFKYDKLRDEKIFRSLYPNKKFDKEKSSLTIRVLFTDMTKLAKKFLQYEMMADGEGLYFYNTTLVYAFQKKNLPDFAAIELLKNLEYINNKGVTNEFYSQRLAASITLRTLFSAGENWSAASEHSKHNLLYIYAYMFQQAAIHINHVFVYKYNFNIPFTGFELVKSFVSSFDPALFDKECPDDGFETKKIVLCSYYLLKSRINENDKESLFNALELFYKFYYRVTNEFRGFYFGMIFNRFIGRLALDRIYSVKASELFDFIFEKNLNDFNPGALLRPYYNALKIKAYLLKTDELIKFIEAFTERIPSGKKEEVKNYSMAYYYFKTRSFGKCLRCVSKNDSLGPLAMVNKYRLKICSLYELGQFEEAIYALESFGQFMKRNNTIGHIIRAESGDFIETAKNLFKLKNNERVESINIGEATKYSIFGDWFKEKIVELPAIKSGHKAR